MIRWISFLALMCLAGCSDSRPEPAPEMGPDTSAPRAQLRTSLLSGGGEPSVTWRGDLAFVETAFQSDSSTFSVHQVAANGEWRRVWHTSESLAEDTVASRRAVEPGAMVFADVLERVSADFRVDPEADQPWIRVGSDADVVLPADFAEAMNEYDSDFRPWGLRAYPDWAVDWMGVDARQSPAAVAGDFNGDGRGDVVVAGRGNDYSARVAFLTSESGVKVVEIERFEGLSGDPAAYGSFQDVMAYVGPGEYGSSLEDGGLILTHDAFVHTYLEKASSIMYWRDGQFVSFSIMD